MRIGTMFLGRVEALDRESIQTKFFVLGVPLVPLSSHYVVADHGNSVSGFDIPLHGKSVALGYLRVGASIAAVLCGVFYYLDRHAYERGPRLLLWTIAFALLTMISVFFLGRLSTAERRRRTILKQLTGVGAPPELLPDEQRDETAKALLTRWQAEHDGQAWDRAIENGATAPLLFAVAEYHLRPDLARRALAQVPVAPGHGPYR